MFSRRPDRPKEEPRFAPPSTSSRPSDLIAVPGSDQAPQVWGGSPVAALEPETRPGGERVDATLIAGRDHIEGALRSSQGVLVLGSFSGTIESETWIRTGEGSTVRADVVADEVVIAGQYEGRLVARGRLEITPTGHVQGDIETPRLLLHEGGVIDGALYMTRTEVAHPGAAPPAEPSKPASVRESGGTSASPRKASGPSDPAVDPAGPAPGKVTGSRGDAAGTPAAGKPAPHSTARS